MDMGILKLLCVDSCHMSSNCHLFVVYLLNFFFLPGMLSFTKKQADLFFPPDFSDDFPVAMQVNKLVMFVIHVTNSVQGARLTPLIFGRHPTNTV